MDDHNEADFGQDHKASLHYFLQRATKNNCVLPCSVWENKRLKIELVTLHQTIVLKKTNHLPFDNKSMTMADLAES